MMHAIPKELLKFLETNDLAVLMFLETNGLAVLMFLETNGLATAMFLLTSILTNKNKAFVGFVNSCPFVSVHI